MAASISSAAKCGHRESEAVRSTLTSCIAVLILPFILEVSPNWTGGNPNYRFPGCNVMGHYRSGPDGRSIFHRSVLQYLRACSHQYSAPNRHSPGNIGARVDDAPFADSGLMAQGAAKIAECEGVKNDIHSSHDSSAH